MSHNLYICGKRTAVVKTHPHIEFEDCINFSTHQTPTKITETILSVDSIEDQIDIYKKWVKSFLEPYKIPIYREDDIFCEYDPIDYQTYDPAQDHIKELNEFIEKCNTGFYKIECYCI